MTQMLLKAGRRKKNGGTKKNSQSENASETDKWDEFERSFM